MKSLVMPSESVQSMLAGTKTLTHQLRGLEEVNAKADRWLLNRIVKFSDGFRAQFTNNFSFDAASIKCPWQVGDQIFIKETYVLESTYEYHEESLRPVDRPYEVCGDSIDGEYFLIPHYKATEPEPHIVPSDREDGFDDTTRWASPILMPQKFGRPELFRTITEIKCERVQDITIDDVEKAGAFCNYESRPHGEYSKWIENWNSCHASPRAVRGGSKWAKVLSVLEWDNERNLAWGIELEPGCKDIVGYVSFPFSEEDGDFRTEIKGRPHYRCMNPWCWTLCFKGE